MATAKANSGVKARADKLKLQREQEALNSAAQEAASRATVGPPSFAMHDDDELQINFDDALVSNDANVSRLISAALRKVAGQIHAGRHAATALSDVADEIDNLINEEAPQEDDDQPPAKASA